MASILVIEEQRGSHGLLQSSLSLAGHDVAVRADDEPEHRRFDLVLVDSTRDGALAAAHRRASRVALYSDGPDAEVRARATAVPLVKPPRTARLIIQAVSGLLATK